MATAQKILIAPHETGLWKIKQTDEAAKKTSELLQKDLEASNNHQQISEKKENPILTGRDRLTTFSSMRPAFTIT